MKKCTKCKIEKPLNGFHKDRRATNGRYSHCIKCHQKCSNQVYSKKREYYKQKHKKYYTDNKGVFRLNSKQYYKKNKKNILKINRQWRENNLTRWKEYYRAYTNKKRKEDINFRLRATMMNMLHRTIDNRNGKKTVELLGYDTKELKSHIESQFIKGMSWKNYGEWEIDHIIPISFFARIGIIDPMIICKLSNLQPLLKKHNRLKSDNIIMYSLKTIEMYI